MVAGGDHTCKLTSEGALICWGENAKRELGHDRLPESNPPTLVPDTGGADPLVHVGLSKGVTCGVHDSGRVTCWGGAARERRRVEGLDDVVQVESHSARVCARRGLGDVTCWREDKRKRTLEPVEGIEGARDLAVGKNHACVVLESGRARCWGGNGAGQLGDGSELLSPWPVDVVDVTDLVQIDAGEAHTCGLDKRGHVWCWGRGRDGQIGDGGTQLRRRPAPVRAGQAGLDPKAPLEGMVEVACGDTFTCARSGEGRVYCWGAGAHGQLGNGQDEEIVPTPVAVVGLEDAVELTAGAGHACAERESGEVVCWGANDNGQIGEGPSKFRPLPTEILLLAVDGSLAIATGAYHACAVLDDEKQGVRCWGWNQYWQLGRREVGNEPTPRTVEGVEGVVQLAAGKNHTCARKVDGTVTCWGSNGRGQMGDERREKRVRPREVGSVPALVDIIAGDNHTCGRTAEGRAYCWGDNRYRQLGDGSAGLKIRPVRVKHVKGIKQLALGGEHTCALDREGEVWCWGRNQLGQLGQGHLRTRKRAKRVLGLGKVREIQARGRRTCARQVDGKVLCWGDGHPDAEELISFEGKVERFQLGVAHLCATTSEGRVLCEGHNHRGQLGDGTRLYRKRLAEVPGLTDIVQLAAGRRFTCALDQQGYTSCWGDNAYGQLGYAPNPNRLRPYPVRDLERAGRP